jgi:hypothetical protein
MKRKCKGPFPLISADAGSCFLFPSGRNRFGESSFVKVKKFGRIENDWGGVEIRKIKVRSLS